MNTIINLGLWLSPHPLRDGYRIRHGASARRIALLNLGLFAAGAGVVLLCGAVLLLAAV